MPALKLPKPRVHIQDARLMRRLLAFLVDLLALDLFVLGSYEAIVSTVSIQQAFSGTSAALTAAAVTIALIALTYFSLFEWLLGQTPGMMLLGIETQGVTLWKSFARNLYFLPVFPFPPIPLCLSPNEFRHLPRCFSVNGLTRFKPIFHKRHQRLR